jgi:hypothetical protein
VVSARQRLVELPDVSTTSARRFGGEAAERLQLVADLARLLAPRGAVASASTLRAFRSSHRQDCAAAAATSSARASRCRSGNLGEQDDGFRPPTACNADDIRSP